MLPILFLLFTLVPLVELSILVYIGQQSEWWVPILLVIVTGVVGAALARWQGWQVLQRIRADAAATHQAVVTAMDVAGQLGFDRLNIATITPPEAQAQ